MGKPYYDVRRVSLEEWQAVLEMHPHPLYYSSWWLDTVAGGYLQTYICYLGELPLAVSAYLYRYGHIITPPYCQYSGILFLDAGLDRYTQQTIQQAMLDALPRHTYLSIGSPGGSDWLGYHWRGCRQTLRYNYVWDLRPLGTEADFVASISHTLRRNLKAARRAGFAYAPATTIGLDEAMSLFASTTQYKGYSADLPLLRRLIATALEQGSGVLVGMRNERGQLAMTSFFALHQGRAYLIAEGTDRVLAGKYQLKVLLLMHYVLASYPGLSAIDFEGSMLEPIAKIYQALGAHQETYHRIERGTRRSLSYLLRRLLS